MIVLLVYSHNYCSMTFGVIGLKFHIVHACRLEYNLISVS